MGKMASLKKKGVPMKNGGLSVEYFGTKQEREIIVKKAMNMVELPEEFMQRLPHMLSGGQMQRVGIARALIVDPKFLRMVTQDLPAIYFERLVLHQLPYQMLLMRYSFFLLLGSCLFVPFYCCLIL